MDLRLSMNQSFVPKNLNPPLNNDDRELGFDVYHLYIAEADQVGTPPQRRRRRTARAGRAGQGGAQGDRGRRQPAKK